MSALSDKDLITAGARGEVGAFATLLERYRDVHTRFAVRMLGGYELADDALQTAFVRAFQSLNRCKETDQFGDWLFRLVISECRARALRRVVRERQGTGEFAAVSANARPLAEDAQAMQRVVDQIEPALREPFLLLYVEELPYARLASLTGAAIQTLERQVDRACARLRELMPAGEGQTQLSRAGMELLSGTPAPSLAVQVAMPLRRPEVLNESFEDRLMSKLLRAGTTSSAASNGDPAQARSGAGGSLPPLPPSPWTAHEPALHGPGSRRMYLAVAGVAGCLALASFITGYAARRWRDVRDVERRRPGKAATVTRIVRRTDTVRVARNDTVVIARFAFADVGAHTVSLVGDFNDWNPAASPLQPGTARGTWSATVTLGTGRYQYAFLVDGKRWVTDGFSRATHEESGVSTSVATFGSGDAPIGDAASARARIRKVLPRDAAERVLAKIASAKEQGLPAGTLEQSALELAAKRLTPKDIEKDIVADAGRLARSRQLIAATPHTSPSGAEVIAGAEALRRGGDSARIVELARAVPARRSVAVPLQVWAQLVGGGMNPDEALDKIRTRVHNDAPDAALERWADETASRLASEEKGKGAKLAKRGGAAEIHQAGSPKATAKTSATKSSGKTKKPSGTTHKP